MLNLSGVTIAHPSEDDDLDEMDQMEDNNVERGDTDSIFKDLGNTIHVDFHGAMVELKESPETDIWPALYQISISLSQALRILHQQTPNNSAVKSANRHVFLEVRAYGLLMCEQELLAEFEPKKETSVLAKLICENKDFRQIYALWQWCQDPEAQDAGGFNDLADEYASMQRIQNARSACLRSFLSGERKYGIDVDAPCPEEDKDIFERHIRIAFSSIRNGKIDEAVQLAHDNGIPAMAAPAKLYKILVDPSLSLIDPFEENHHIPKRWFESARIFHKLIDAPKASQRNYTRLLWAAVSGKLQPLLSVATRTTDRLWCFANAAVVNMLLEACTGQVLEEVPRTVESIFAEITAEEKSPYYSIYPYLLRDDWEGLINWMVEYVDSRISSESRMDDQLIRFMATLATVARIKQHQHDEVAASTLFTLLIDQLVSKSIFSVIPFYASYLPRDIANDRLVDIMEHIRGDKNRKEYLYALESSDFDRDQMAIVAASETGDLQPITRISNLRWLLLNGERTLDNCVSQINSLVRYFTLNDDHQTSLEVLTESLKFGIPEKLSTVIATADKKTFPALYASNIAEYDCHRLFYFETFPSCEKLSEQAIIIQKLIHDVKSIPTTSQITLYDNRLLQTTAREVQNLNRDTELTRRKETAQILKQKTIELIEKLLLHKGWYCSVNEPERIEELIKVRNICCSTVIELYMASCHAIGDQDSVVEAGVLLAKPKINIEKVLNRDDLRRIAKKLVDFTNSVFR